MCRTYQSIFTVEPDDANVARVEEWEAGIRRARTMTLIFMCSAELLRAYSSRSLRQSVFLMSICSNFVIGWTWLLSMLGLIAVVVTPGLQDVFKLTNLSSQEWLWSLGLSVVPFAADEGLKAACRA